MSQPNGTDVTGDAPERCRCAAAGKWGATGILPVDHHVHFLTDAVNRITGSYLAHGAPNAADAAIYRGQICDAYDRRVAEAAARRDRQLAAAGLL